MIPLSAVVAEVGELTGPEEERVRNAIAAATATLGRELHYYLGPPLERDELLDVGTYLDRVTLSEEPTPETEMTVQVRTDLFTAWEDEPELDEDDEPNWVLDGNDLVHRSGWPAGRKTVKVTYVAGHDAGDGPEHLQALVLQMVVDKWNARTVEATVAAGLKKETIGDYSYENFGASELTAAAASIGTDWETFARRWRRGVI